MAVSLRAPVRQRVYIPPARALRPARAGPAAASRPCSPPPPGGLCPRCVPGCPCAQGSALLTLRRCLVSLGGCTGVPLPFLGSGCSLRGLRALPGGLGRGPRGGGDAEGALFCGCRKATLGPGACGAGAPRWAPRRLLPPWARAQGFCSSSMRVTPIPPPAALACPAGSADPGVARTEAATSAPPSGAPRAAE